MPIEIAVELPLLFLNRVYIRRVESSGKVCSCIFYNQCNNKDDVNNSQGLIHQRSLKAELGVSSHKCFTILEKCLEASYLFCYFFLTFTYILIVPSLGQCIPGYYLECNMDVPFSADFIDESRIKVI